MVSKNKAVVQQLSGILDNVQPGGGADEQTDLAIRKCIAALRENSLVRTALRHACTSRLSMNL